MEFGWCMALCVPFLGTVMGAAAVLGLPLGDERVRRGMDGFAAGSMTGAVFCNLLMPGGEISILFTGLGFLIGLAIFLITEGRLVRIESQETAVGVLLLAMVLHNIPEGLAVGISGGERAGTVIGIAVQNIPDGAVAAVPLVAMGTRKGKAFLLGALTGAVEPLAALAALGLQGCARWMEAALMGFAAGAMAYVVIRELTPRMREGQMGMLCYGVGVMLMIAIGGIT